MPLLWRYFITHFLSVTGACVLAFISILLTMRLDEIAHFAALGAPLSMILLFIFYQIPYILPIALPLSCLISSLIFMQRISITQELTALRASGFSLKNLVAPILISAAFLALLNFWVISEIATQTHLHSNLLKSELRSINPLLLLHNKHLMRLKGLYFETLGPSHVGESASDVILAMPNHSNQRLNLMLAKNLTATSTSFIGKEVTLLTTTPHDNLEEFDDLLIEHIKDSLTRVEDFSKILQKKVWTINNDYLTLPLLLVRLEEQKKTLNGLKDKNEKFALKKQINRSMSEITKRLSISMAVISMTLMGTAFGINISRRGSRRNLAFVILMTLFYLVSFFVAKGTDENFVLASILYLAPLFIIAGISCVVMNRVSQGKEF
ncbi:MAG: LptF/LptG family permease [Candidatus Protochlamydia sp.]|nr:LptF/LptG family permease [Candidatus Protochlamydia sp.]